MNSISAALSGVKVFFTNKQNRPKIILGSVCVLAGILIGCEWMRERSSIDLPLHNKTIIPIPTQEMNRLMQMQQTTEEHCKETQKAFLSQEEKVNNFYQKMQINERAHTPEFMRPFIGSLVGANLKDVNNYNDALANNELLKSSLNQCNMHLQSINEQVAQTHNWAEAEGNLITHRQAIQTMNELVGHSDHSLKDHWQMLSNFEKVNYYVPTDFLRRQFSALTGTDSQKVSDCIMQNDVLNQLHGEIKTLNREIQSDYKKIYASIHKKIELASLSQLERVQAKEILQTYQLSAKLHVAANNAWYKILSYHLADQVARDKENALRSCVYCSEADINNLKTSIRTAIFGAEIAKIQAQTQIGYVQRLASDLDPQILKIQNYRQEYIANPLKNSLQGAIFRIELADFWEKLTDPSLRLFHNIAKTFTHLNIQAELNSISENAKVVSAQLENILVDVFMTERLFHAEKNTLIAADTSEIEAQKFLRTYLNDLADPGFLERL